MNDRLDRSVELELRQDIKELRQEVNDNFTEIKVSLEGLKTKQNIGAWIFKSLLTIVVATVCGIFGAHLSK